MALVMLPVNAYNFAFGNLSYDKLDCVCVSVAVLGGLCSFFSCGHGFNTHQTSGKLVNSMIKQKMDCSYIGFMCSHI